MDIVVIGAGAMGCLFGGLLTEAGNQVRLIDIPGPHLNALVADGLTLTTDAGERRIQVVAGTADSFSNPCELAIVFTKGAYTEAALRAAAHLIGPGTHVLTVQNGLGNDDAIRRAVPAAKIIVGMTNWPADLAGVGRVTSHGTGQTHIWCADPADEAAVRAIASGLTDAGLNGIADPDVWVSIWEKVAFNAAMNAVSAVSRKTVGAMADHPAGRSLVRAVVREAIAVAQASGVPADESRVWRTVEMAFAEHRAHKPSMLQDILAGRPTEIETINGAIVVRAEALGLDAPVTRTLADLVRLIGHPVIPT